MRLPTSLAVALAAVTGLVGLGFGSSSAVAISIGVRPSLLRWGQQATIFGSIPSTRANEKVVVEVKECRQPSFRSLAWAYSETGGSWSIDIEARSNSTLRASWGDDTSDTVSVQQRPGVQLVYRPGRMSDVAIGGIYPFARKRVSIEVFDTKTRTWRKAQSVVLSDYGGAGNYVWTSAKFKARVPANAQIRAVLPRSQAKPCYLAGYSPIVQT
jgi:hypothetical protein